MKMTMMRRLVTPVLLLALLTLPVVAEDLARGKPEDVGLSSTRLQRLTDAMQAYVREGRLAGGVHEHRAGNRVALVQSSRDGRLHRFRTLLQ